MNPGERDPAPYAQPGPIMSSASDATAPLPPPFDPNNNPYYRPQRKSKKPIIIAAAALVGIIVLVTVIAILPGAIKTITMNSNLADLKLMLGNHSESVSYYESEFVTEKASRHHNILISFNQSIEYEAFKKKLKTGLEDVKDLREKLNGFGNVKAVDNDGNSIDIDAEIASLKQSLDERLKYYTEYSSVYLALAEVHASNGEKQTIESLKQATTNNTINKTAEALQSYYEAKKAYTDLNCTKGQKSKSCYNAATEFQKREREAKENNTIDEILLSASNRTAEVDNPLNIMSKINDAKTVAEEKK